MQDVESLETVSGSVRESTLKGRKHLLAEDGQ